MRKSTLTTLLVGIAFLVVCCFFTNGHAQNSDVGETVRGKIEMTPASQWLKVNFNSEITNDAPKSGTETSDHSK